MTRGNLSIIAAVMVMFLAAVWRAVGSFGSPDPTLDPAPTLASMAALPLHAEVPRPESMRRPLFSQASTEFLAYERESPVTTATVTQLPRLVGVITDGNRGVAIFSYEGKILRIFENTQVGDWTVIKIERRSALLQRRAETRLLTLDTGFTQQ